jgi:uncharacterized protein HemY
MEKEGWEGKQRAQAFAEIGMLYRRDGEFEAAAESLREALDELPDCAVAWANLAASYGDVGIYPGRRGNGASALSLTRRRERAVAPSAARGTPGVPGCPAGKRRAVNVFLAAGRLPTLGAG